MDDLTAGEILLRTSGVNIDLPPRGTKRWVARRKAAVVTAVRSGAISLEEACRRYELSEEEFYAWEQRIAAYGVPGLRVTRLQIYRDGPPPKHTKRGIDHSGGENRANPNPAL
jgi:hypothetical protein